jgi:hypothetical protein
MRKHIPFAFALMVMLLCGALSCAMGDNDGADGGDVPVASLAGTIWQWQHRAFYFLTETEMEYHRMASYEGSPPDSIPYAYAYDGEAKKGEIVMRGKFLVSADGTTMYFPNYSSYGHSATFTRVEEAVWPQ